MTNIGQLEQKIEKSRQNLMAVAENRELSNPKVVSASRCFDALFNEYIILARKRI
jgi:hypothetical protein